MSTRWWLLLVVKLVSSVLQERMEDLETAIFSSLQAMSAYLLSKLTSLISKLANRSKRGPRLEGNGSQSAILEIP